MFDFKKWKDFFTGFEIASGEMPTFTFPEAVVAIAENLWK